MIIMQGASGHGKSFIAQTLAAGYFSRNEGIKVRICSADQFWIDDNGFYAFDVHRLGEAHDQCRNSATDAMEREVDVIIIDNTNTRKSEAQYYLDLAHTFGYDVQVIRVSADDKTAEEQNESRSADRVIPATVIQKQLNRMEDIL